MITTRGINYYTIEDISKVLFKTPDSKHLEALMENGFDPGTVSHIPHFDIKTDHLSFFTGNFLIRLIPKKAVWTYFKLQEVSSAVSSSESQTFPDKDIQKISGRLDSIYEELAQLMEDMNADIVTKKNYENIPVYVLAYLIGDGQPLKFVRSGQIDLINPFLTDERVYTLENGEQRYEEDGLPMDLFYSYDNSEAGITYSKWALPGYRRVGT